MNSSLNKAKTSTVWTTWSVLYSLVSTGTTLLPLKLSSQESSPGSYLPILDKNLNEPAKKNVGSLQIFFPNANIWNEKSLKTITQPLDSTERNQTVFTVKI